MYVCGHEACLVELMLDLLFIHPFDQFNEYVEGRINVSVSIDAS